MTKLINLSILGSRWYATTVDGNLTRNNPTNFSCHLSRDEVVAEIRRRTPNVEIDLPETLADDFARQQVAKAAAKIKDPAIKAALADFVASLSKIPARR